MQCSDPGEMNSIHSVAVPGGCALGLLGAGVSKPPKTWLPKAEPFSGGGFSSTSLPYAPESPRQELMQVGELCWRCLLWVLSWGCQKQETGSKGDGCQLAGTSAGASVAMGQVGSP